MSQKIINYLIDQVKSLDFQGHPVVIAGGAVANSLLNERHSLNSPINDIDVFLFVKNDKPKDSNLDGAEDDYSGEIKGTENNLQISSSKRDGIFNLIEVKVDHILDIEILLTQLLERFDINATMAGITISSNPRLITLRAFNQFLDNRQIRCVRTHTPVKTILRLLKKEKELSAYLDPRHIEAIYQFSRFKNSQMTEEIYLKFYDQIMHLNPYLRVFKMSTGKYKVFLKKEFIKLHRNEKSIMKSGDSYILLPVFEAFLTNNKIYQKYLKVRPYQRVLSTFLGYDLFESKMRRDFNENNLIEVEKVLRKVQVLKLAFRKWDLKETIDASLFLKRIDNDDLFMAYSGYLAINQTELKVSELATHLIQFKQDYENDLQQLTIPLEIPKDLKNSVRELLTRYSLMEEGKKLNHCVGGYWDKVASGLCRIISITTSEGSSTMEIVPVAGHWSALQHRSRFNKFPPDTNREIAVELMKFLQKWPAPEVEASSEFSRVADF